MRACAQARRRTVRAREGLAPHAPRPARGVPHLRRLRSAPAPQTHPLHSNFDGAALARRTRRAPSAARPPREGGAGALPRRVCAAWLWEAPALAQSSSRGETRTGPRRHRATVGTSLCAFGTARPQPPQLLRRRSSLRSALLVRRRRERQSTRKDRAETATAATRATGARTGQSAWSEMRCVVPARSARARGRGARSAPNRARPSLALLVDAQTRASPISSCRWCAPSARSNRRNCASPPAGCRSEQRPHLPNAALSTPSSACTRSPLQLSPPASTQEVRSTGQLGAVGAGTSSDGAGADEGDQYNPFADLFSDMDDRLERNLGALSKQSPAQRSVVP